MVSCSGDDHPRANATGQKGEGPSCLLRFSPYDGIYGPVRAIAHQTGPSPAPCPCFKQVPKKPRYVSLGLKPRRLARPHQLAHVERARAHELDRWFVAAGAGKRPGELGDWPSYGALALGHLFVCRLEPATRFCGGYVLSRVIMVMNLCM
jgi:hypothetical protein